MELSETEKFWITRCIEDYVNQKEKEGALMHPKDRNILTVLLAKLAIAEKGYQVRIEIKKL